MPLLRVKPSEKHAIETALHIFANILETATEALASGGISIPPHMNSTALRQLAGEIERNERNDG